MKLTTRSRYATRMMVELARHHQNGPLQLGEIAKKQRLSLKYLEQLIIPLKKAGLIKSQRGSKGGHMLARPPEEISIWEIVSLLEGDEGVTPCVSYPDLCEMSETCPTRDVWDLLSEVIRETLSRITLAELAHRYEQKLQKFDNQKQRRS
ncbi:Rrf2 family transcriptional regulator [Thermosulfuriphilus ammonigenes]|uniref:Rrf2 family transcriptional regulator n=1 Tax=Thermosulfuriphilus ammonigenes TaxID=1936021 RepID=A0A6G7PVV2_9BACT|nr:Rrf2 family transcriptional regulator [Thermosulfuriphilus ammonigenes]MBA2847997.1 Rrf2 family protein [Thermosulfuriphilus ammonigenes]QIJ71815.1 Rrf2 family transcriptional regulator [Thermosulfuriphilus ammonigenes]